MKDKKPLTYMLGEIDEKHLDEYYARRSRRSARRTVFRYCSLAASVVLALAVSVAVLPMISNRPDNIPADTAGSAMTTAVSDTDNATKPTEKEQKIIYAEASEDDDYELKDIVESESLPNAIIPGQVSFAKKGGLYEIMQSDDQYENCVFAVMIACNQQTVTSDNNWAAETSDYTYAIGLKTKKVTVVLNNGTDNEKSFEAEIAHLSKKQLLEFDVPDYVGVEFTLIPQWMDADDRIVRRPLITEPPQTQ